MMKSLLCLAVLVAFCSWVEAAASPLAEIRTEDDELVLYSPIKISYVIGSADPVSLASVKDLASAAIPRTDAVALMDSKIAALETRLNQKIADLDAKYAALDAQNKKDYAASLAALDAKYSSLDVQNKKDFSTNVNNVVYRSEKVFDWKSHTRVGVDPHGYISIGQAHTDEVLHVDVMDSGCNSGIGLSFTIAANWGVDRGSTPNIFPAGSAESSISKRFSFYYRPLTFDTYAVFLVIAGWVGACDGQFDMPHRTTVIVTASDARFTMDKNNTLAWDAVVYKPMYESFTDRSVRTQTYLTHSTTEVNKHGWIPVGKASVDQVLKIDVMDTGCDSGFGATFTITSSWGIDGTTLAKPEAATQGVSNSAMASLVSRVSFWYKPLAKDSFHIYLRMEGWGPCGGQVGLQHTSTVVVESSSEYFDPDYETVFNSTQYLPMIMANQQVKNTNIDTAIKNVTTSLDASIKVVNTTIDGVNTAIKNVTASIDTAFKNATARIQKLSGWVPVTFDMITAIDPVNTQVVITANAGVTIYTTPLNSGCGAVGSSDTYFISGNWTKIRYTQHFWGSTACYSVFGSDSYAYPNGTLGQHSITVNGNNENSLAVQYSQADNGLFPLDLNAGDRIYNLVNLNKFGTNDWRDDSSMCTNDGHFWSQVITGDRVATVELRRLYTTDASGKKTYHARAGPSTGVSCTNINTCRWQYEAISVYFEE